MAKYRLITFKSWRFRVMAALCYCFLIDTNLRRLINARVATSDNNFHIHSANFRVVARINETYYGIHLILKYCLTTLISRYLLFVAALSNKDFGVKTVKTPSTTSAQLFNDRGDKRDSPGASPGMLHIIAPTLSRNLVPKQYNQLESRTRINWNIRIVSFTQAITICGMALRVILTDPVRKAMLTRDDRLWGYSSSLGKVQAWALGYFLYDTVISVQYWDVLGPTSLIHGAMATLITILGFRPFANYYGVNFVLYELSTPFLNIHWILDKLKMTGSNLQFYNGICLMASFFGCRLAWGGYQTWLLTKDIVSSWRSHLAGEPVVPRLLLENGALISANDARDQEFGFPGVLLGTYLVANTVLTGLNFYWFGLMVKAMRKRFTGADTGEKKGTTKRAKS